MNYMGAKSLVLRIPLVRPIAQSRLVTSWRYRRFLISRGKKTGLLDSAIARRPLTATKVAIPWIPHSCIHFLNSLDLKGLSLVEFGSGNSSIWFASRVQKIKSFEVDKNWIIELRKTYNYLGEIVHVAHDFIFSVEDLRADVLLIDGFDRISILEKTVQGILHGEITPSLIIVDNSNWFPKAVSSAIDKIDYIRVDFTGLTPAIWSESMTTVLISRKISRTVFSDFSKFGHQITSGEVFEATDYDRVIDS